MQSKPKQKLPLGKIFRSGTLWALFVLYFCSAYGSYFFVTWMPTFLMEEHGLTLQQSGWYAAVPMGVSALACLTGGWLSDWLSRRLGSVKLGRRVVGVCSYALAAVGFGIAGQTRDPVSAIFWLTFAHGVHDLALPVAWATCVDVGGTPRRRRHRFHEYGLISLGHGLAHRRRMVAKYLRFVYRDVHLLHRGLRARLGRCGSSSTPRKVSRPQKKKTQKKTQKKI